MPVLVYRKVTDEKIRSDPTFEAMNQGEKSINWRIVTPLLNLHKSIKHDAHYECHYPKYGCAIVSVEIFNHASKAQQK